MPKNAIGKSRRDFLIKSMFVVPALAVNGVALNAVAASQGSKTSKKEISENKVKRGYRPTFFNQEEFAFIKAAVDRLIPKDNLGPGALEAGVPEFIDRQMQTPISGSFQKHHNFSAYKKPDGHSLSSIVGLFTRQRHRRSRTALVGSTFSR